MRVCVSFFLFCFLLFCMCALPSTLFKRYVSKIIIFEMRLHCLNQAVIGHSKAHNNAINIVFYCRCYACVKENGKERTSIMPSIKKKKCLLLDKVTIGSEKKCTRTMAVNVKVKQGCAHNNHIFLSLFLSLLSSASRLLALKRHTFNGYKLHA